MTHAQTDVLREHVIEALEEVHDACCVERQISIVQMGLVDEVEVAGGHARVRLVLTTGWCPFSGDMMGDAERRLRALPGITDVSIDVRWDKAWDRSRMAPGVADGLRLLPEPGNVADRDAFVAAARRSASRLAGAGAAR